jgi:hypothetical protein
MPAESPAELVVSGIVRFATRRKTAEIESTLVAVIPPGNSNAVKRV